MLNRACDACKRSVESRKGRLQVKEAARAVSERDDRCAVPGVDLAARKAESCQASASCPAVHFLLNAAMPCRMLSLQLATLEAQNKEVAGDDDADEDDEGMGQLDVDAPALQVN